MVGASIAATACFTVGTSFQAPKVSEAQLGRMTDRELLSSLGPDAGRPSSVTRRGVRMDCYEFDSYKAGFSAVGKGLAGRSAEYCFAKGVLVGYIVTSNLSEDSTDFDLGKARTIARGMTRAQVIGLLGNPAGAAIAPIAELDGGIQLRYSYTGYHGTLTMQKDVLKDAFIELDSTGTVLTSRIDEQLR